MRVRPVPMLVERKIPARSDLRGRGPTSLNRKSPIDRSDPRSARPVGRLPGSSGLADAGIIRRSGETGKQGPPAARVILAIGTRTRARPPGGPLQDPDAVAGPAGGRPHGAVLLPVVMRAIPLTGVGIAAASAAVLHSCPGSGSGGTCPTSPRGKIRNALTHVRLIAE